MDQKKTRNAAFEIFLIFSFALRPGNISLFPCIPAPCSSAPKPTLFFISSTSSCLFSRRSLPSIVQHLEQSLQQPVVSVSVRLDVVKAVAVVAVDTVLGAPVLVDQVQSLVQLLCRELCWKDALAQLLLPPAGGGPRCGVLLLLLLLGRGSLSVEGGLQETQQRQRGGVKGV